jgi:DNA excision repair protein ERCC-2
MSAAYSVSVRGLCEFTAKSGDLSARFTPAPTAQQGIAGHQRAAARRGPGYQRELTLEGRHDLLEVRGRADGYDPRLNRLEEFKTHRGDLERMPANQRGLHWAQLKMYGAMLCVKRGLPGLELALVYVDIEDDTETCFREQLAAEDLEREFNDHCARFLAWAIREMAHRELRDRRLKGLTFPHASLRSGQRQMAEAVFRAAVGGKALLVEAPTGIGKTVGSLFPMLKAVPRQRLDKLFFLVAKISGREPVRHALELLGTGVEAPKLRVLELIAKEAACEYPGRPCEAQSCPLARDFYDRLPAARALAIDTLHLDRDSVRRAALSHHVCPYYLTQELIRWCDVIVGDYHYFFDTSAILHALTRENQWRVGLLVDEAHNLLVRGRDMYSASLVPAVLADAVRAAPPALRRPLAEVEREWRAIHGTQADGYAVHACVSETFIGSLRQATTLLAEYLAQGPAPPERPTPGPSTQERALLTFYFQALHFCRMNEEFDSHSLFDVTLQGAGATLCIRCVNPGEFLRSRFAAAATAVLFSATLSPGAFYRTLLGLPESTAWINVPSPFDERQLEVRIEPRISTRYHDRARSLDPIVELMARQYRARPGNYLAFFSSFEYLDAVLGLFEARVDDIPVWRQTRGMSAAERGAFLARFTPTGVGIGFAVLGGAFAEGIDLPGERLIGAFIATLGLPQVNEVNSEIERRLQRLFGCGYEYTYLYPGLQKVVQAAGRVIRTATDRGTVILIDDRYQSAGVRRLLPEWWRV